MLVGGTNKKKTVRYELDVTAKDNVVSNVTAVISLAQFIVLSSTLLFLTFALLMQPTAVADLTPGRPWRPSTGWTKRKNLLDYDNNGYT